MEFTWETSDRFLAWARDVSTLAAPLAREDAERLALEAAEEDRRRFDLMGGRGLAAWNWIGAFELHRCWVFLLYAWPNMPPGVGVVVDKTNRAATTHRWIDIEHLLDAATFDVTPGVGRTVRYPGHSKPPSRPLRTRAELPGGDGSTEGRRPDATFMDADDASIRVEVWFDDITGLSTEIDTAGRRYRLSGLRTPEGCTEWVPYADDKSDA